MSQLPEPGGKQVDGKRVAYERMRVLAQHRSRLVAIAVGVGLDPHQAEDAAHDAMIRVSCSPATIAHDSLSRYAMVAVRNVALNILRNAVRDSRLAVHGALREEPILFDDGVLSRLLARNVLANMLKSQSALTIEMLTLWAIGYTHTELAYRYGLSQSAVQSRLHRALRRERHLFDDY